METNLPTSICQGLCLFTRGYIPVIQPKNIGPFTLETSATKKICQGLWASTSWSRHRSGLPESSVLDGKVNCGKPHINLNKLDIRKVLGKHLYRIYIVLCIYIVLENMVFHMEKPGSASFLGYLYRPDYAGSLTGADICLCLIHLTWDGDQLDEGLDE